MENQVTNNTDDSTRLKQLEKRIERLEQVVGNGLGCIHDWDEKLMKPYGSPGVIYKKCKFCGIYKYEPGIFEEKNEIEI